MEESVTFIVEEHAAVVHVGIEAGDVKQAYKLKHGSSCIDYIYYCVLNNSYSILTF